jgi:D-alanyl-lipoteichoic acid acyltransferase DltB (MBOAT superfamily)
MATARNLLLTFLLGGLWHGAGWTFIAWGALHGAAMVVHRAWSALQRPLPVWLAWLATFLFVVVAWVFFRAASVADAFLLLSGMAGMRGIAAPAAGAMSMLLVGLAIGLALCRANTNLLVEKPLSRGNAGLTVAALVAGLLSLGQTSPFIYFNF